MRALSLAVALLLLAETLNAGNKALSASQLERVKHICAGLLDTQYLSKPWKQLESYYRDEHAVASETVCSASCGGEIALRDSYSVTCLYANPMKVGSGKPWGPRDALVWSISVRKGDKVIFHRETEPKPTTERPW
jgi:hypothetical protein